MIYWNKLKENLHQKWLSKSHKIMLTLIAVRKSTQTSMFFFTNTSYAKLKQILGPCDSNLCFLFLSLNLLNVIVIDSNISS